MAFLTTPSEGVEYALWNTTGRKIRSAFWGGRARVFTVQTAAITLAAGGQINMARLDTGTVVHDGRVTWSATGAANKMWIGDAGDCDRYKTEFSTVVASLDQTGGALGDCTRFNNPAGHGYSVEAGNNDVILTNSYAAATGALAAGAIKVTLFVGNE